MRHVRIMGLALVAVFAMAAVAATSASATPEWGKCEAKAGGKFAEGNCQKKAAKGTGTFEWIKNIEIKNKGFSGNNVGAGGVLTSSLVLCSGPESVQEKRVPASKCTGEGGSVVPFITVAVECESEHNTGDRVG